MALDPLEMGLIVVIGLVLFLWGPQKIPEMAKAFGRAKKEFDAATKEFQNAAASMQGGSIFDPTAPRTSTNAQAVQAAWKAAAIPAVTSPVPPSSPSSTASAGGAQQATPAPQAKSGDELLIDTARELGIPTQGKTREEIKQEILAMAKSNKGSPAPQPSQPQQPEQKAA